MFFNYLDAIASINRLGNGQRTQWFFYPGMLFQSNDTWWGDFQNRISSHEGIDLTYYKNLSGSINSFTPETKIPSLDEGVIVNICKDFLGQTIVVEHDNKFHPGHRLIFTYAHITPDTTLHPGDRVIKNQVIGHVCDTHTNPSLTPHLHFSSFLIPSEIAYEAMDWHLFSTDDEILKINPVFL